MEMAQRAANLLTPGSYVNLGIGLPTAVADAVSPELAITFFCENGLIGYTGLPQEEEPDPDVIDAGSKSVKLLPGAAVVPHEVSFMIARGGHLDYAILGAHQVSSRGDIANWAVPGEALAGVGGAMDLAVGARTVVVMMRHTDRDGSPKILDECTYPLTARGVVSLILTDLAIIEVTPAGLVVKELAEDVSFESLQDVTGASLLAPAAAPSAS